MPVNQMEVGLLVEKTLHGDRRAGNALADLCYSLIHGVALGMVRDADAADDIVQETLLQAYLHLDTLQDRTKFSPWVQSIAANLSRNWLTRYQNRRQSLEEGTGTRPAIFDALVELQTPESEYLQEEKRWIVVDALCSLPKADRELLMQFYFRRMSYQEIAAHLGVSEQVVQGRLQAVRNRLKGKISQTAEEVLDEVLVGHFFPTQLHGRKRSKNFPKIDINTDPNKIFCSGLPRIIKVGPVYKAWVLLRLGGRADIFSIPFQIIHLTSPDGRHWTNRGSVFEVWANPSSDRFDRYEIGDFCVLYDGSMYRMWYTGCMGPQAGESKIGYAVSPDGLEWQRISGSARGGAVLEQGAADAFDGDGAESPFVLCDDGHYKMWYGARERGDDPYSTTRTVHIAYAESTDGIIWEKWGKVLSPGGSGAFDTRWIYPGSVVRDGSIYRMLYGVDDDIRRVYAIGYATSSDGVAWKKRGKVAGGESAFDHASHPSLVWDKEERRMWYQTLEGIACIEWDRLVTG